MVNLIRGTVRVKSHTPNDLYGRFTEGDPEGKLESIAEAKLRRRRWLIEDRHLKMKERNQ
jgi:hypothetical protein